jgi:hypothetical protein
MKDYQKLEYLPELTELSLFEIQKRIFIPKTPFESLMHIDTEMPENNSDKIFYE